MLMIIMMLMMMTVVDNDDAADAVAVSLNPEEKTVNVNSVYST